MREAAAAGIDRSLLWVTFFRVPAAVCYRSVSVQHQRSPAAVVYAHNTADVQAAVKCAYARSVQVGFGVEGLRRVSLGV
jgi:hypothetical protein